MKKMFTQHWKMQKMPTIPVRELRKVLACGQEHPDLIAPSGGARTAQRARLWRGACRHHITTCNGAGACPRLATSNH
eukprot:2702160-Alexandrium_andersonii.AAC.1